MTARTRRRRSPLKVAVGCMLVFCLIPAQLASAQSPYPNGSWADWAPNNVQYGANGIIIEGLGMFGCGYSLSSVKAATVQTINDGHATLTEVSPQSYCASLSQYEIAIGGLINYVEVYADDPGKYWGGVILDEEPGFGFSVSQLITLNQYVESKIATLASGATWWWTNIGNCQSCWSQSQYTSLTTDAGGYPAPQVYNDFMATQANGAGFTENMVTTSAEADYPYDSASYAIGKVYGQPFYASFGGSYHYWTWPWTPK